MGAFPGKKLFKFNKPPEGPTFVALLVAAFLFMGDLKILELNLDADAALPYLGVKRLFVPPELRTEEFPDAGKKS